VDQGYRAQDHAIQPPQKEIPALAMRYDGRSEGEQQGKYQEIRRHLILTV
jgi:hypothetical protein